MIQAIVGYQGSGKTFRLVWEAHRAIKRGYKVFTNVRIKGTYQLTWDDLVNYTFPPGSVVLIDEAGRYFNSRKWSQLPDAVFDLFTLERHLRLTLIIAVQNFNRIDKSLREVIELVWWARNIPMMPFFMYEGYYDVEHVGLKGECQTRSIVWRWTKSRKLYDTHGMASTIDKGFIPEIPWFPSLAEIERRGGFRALFCRRKESSVIQEEDEPADPGECLACEVDPDRVADTPDLEVSDVAG